MIKNLTIGSDAEVFLRSIVDKSVFPSCGLVGGTKEKPKTLGGGGYFIQEDNVLVEFNIPPCKDRQSFISAISTGLSRVKNQIPPSLYVDISPSANIHKAFLEIEQACVFGCEADLNAWLKKVNPRPRSEDPTLRSAAAHIHLGWDNPTDEQRHDVIYAADLFAGIPSLFEDKDKKRRELYGKAGAFRMKPYGVEHRVLSNYWLGMDKHGYGVIYDRYTKAIDFVNSKSDGSSLFTLEEAQDIQTAINNFDMSIADKLVTKYHLV